MSRQTKTTMHRRALLAAGAALAAAPGRAGAKPRVADRLAGAPAGAVRLRGRIGKALDLSARNRLGAQDWRRLVAAFQTRTEQRCWQSEFWGKWFTGAAAAYGYTGDAKLRAALVGATQGLVATQSADGYIGNYDPAKHLEAWDVWGRKYCLLGLLASYEITRDGATLAAARRLADHLMTEVGPGKRSIVTSGWFRGMASSSVLEPIVLLFRATGDRRYLAFAEHIVGEWSRPEGPQLLDKAFSGAPLARRFPPPAKWWSQDNGGKAYEMMSCYEGLLELHRETGNARYLEAARRTADAIREEEITIAGSGASYECWYGGRRSQAHPAKHMMETCVTATWIKLCGNLLRLTGAPALFDDIERAAYNAMLAAMMPDGSVFSKYSPFEGFREIGEEQCKMGLHCCTASGPRGLFLLPRLAVMQAAEGPVVNLYERGEATVALASGTRVTIVQDTSYPAGDTIRLEVRPARPARFTLALRIPAWSEANELAVGGAPLPAPAPGTYARVERRWQPGDRLTLKLDLRARLVAAPDGALAAAVVRGPVVLARDSRLSPDDVDEPALPQHDGARVVPLAPVPATDERIWMQFRVPFSGGAHDRKGELALCDYASAGNAWDARNRFRVWLRQELDPRPPGSG